MFLKRNTPARVAGVFFAADHPPRINKAAETLLLKIFGRLLHLSGHLLFEPIHFNQVNPIKTASKVRNSRQTHNPLFTGGTFVGFEKPQPGPIL